MFIFLVLIFIAIDLLRENKYIKIFFNLFFNRMMRKHELDGALTGASWVMISLFLLFSFSQKILQFYH